MNALTSHDAMRYLQNCTVGYFTETNRYIVPDYNEDGNAVAWDWYAEVEVEALAIPVLTQQAINDGLALYERRVAERDYPCGLLILLCCGIADDPALVQQIEDSDHLFLIALV